MTRKKILTIIITSILGCFLLYLLTQTIITIYMVNKLRPTYEDDVINKYLLLAYTQFSCVIAASLDLASFLHLLLSKKHGGEEKMAGIASQVFNLIFSFSVSISAIYIIKYNILFHIDWFPYALLIHNAAALFIFIIEFFLPTKRKMLLLRPNESKS